MTKEQAYEKLELPVGADLQVVRQKFQQMHNSFQVQIDGAFREDMRQKLQARLMEFEEAFKLLNGSEGADDSASLPWTEKSFDVAIPATHPLEQSNQQPDLEQSLILFGLSRNQDPDTIITRVQQHIEELRAQSEGVKIPEAKALYRKEISKAERAKEVIAMWLNTIVEKQRLEEERLQREAAERQRIEALRAQEEQHRRRQVEEAQRQEAIRKQEEKKLQYEREKLAAERKQWETEAKLREEQFHQAEQLKENPTVQTSAPSKQKKGNKIILFCLLSIVIGGIGYLILVKPNTNTVVDDNTSSIGKDMEVIDEQGQALSETNALASRDSANWDVASTEGNIASYVHYLEKEPNGAFREQAQQAITILEKKDQQKVAEEKEREKQRETAATKEAQQKAIFRQAMQQYNEDVAWAKNMIGVAGCSGCSKNETCKKQVLDKLNNALKNHPNGIEAKELMQCLLN